MRDRRRPHDLNSRRWTAKQMGSEVGREQKRASPQGPDLRRASNRAADKQTLPASARGGMRPLLLCQPRVTLPPGKGKLLTMSRPTIIWMLSAIVCCLVVSLLVITPSDGRYHPIWIDVVTRAVGLGLGGFVTLAASLWAYRDPSDRRRYIAPSAALAFYLGITLLIRLMVLPLRV